MAQLHGLGVGDTHHRRGMETHAHREAAGQCLMRGLPCQQRGRIVRADAGREAAMLLEVLLELLGVHTALAAFLGRVAEHLGPFAVKVDQLLGHDLAL
ncbi:hypothetical protein SDC9_155783 [bioreactor metagenome]|uniref:Uncharacterized protein n=1 Tax=bioreactor metagenome TaxID=1076179 RepID=A0A645F2L9_9ZZZZ